MSSEEPSTSGCHSKAEGGESSQDLYITHQVSKLDTLAGLAVKYHVTVADIKRANGLLSDTAMFAKDTLLIPTRSLPVGVEYSTWAGMIVTQYGRIPGNVSRTLAFGNSSPPKQSASLDMLQRYYGTGDTASEPCDFRPGDPEAYESSTNGTEIEMSEMDHLGRLRHHRGLQEEPDCPESIEYAGSRSGAPFATWQSLNLCSRKRNGHALRPAVEPGRQRMHEALSKFVTSRSKLSPVAAGTLADERLRRRKAGDLSANSSPLRGSGCQPTDDSPEGAGGMVPSSSQAGHRRALTHSQSLGQRESIIERLKRVASQPALALPQAPSLARISDAVVAPLTESLPPLPPGSKTREKAGASSSWPREKEGRKAD